MPPPEFEGIIDGYIVGLHHHGNGRSCILHDVCGRDVQVNSLIRFKTCQVRINKRYEEAIKAVWVVCGEERCTVGFLPRSVAHEPGAKENYQDEFAMILYLYSDSEDINEISESNMVLGKASFRLLKNIPCFE
jgi:ABC-type sugar transport system ATPase subunit